MTNSEDPDQMPHSVASDLGLHCKGLSVPILRVVTVMSFFFRTKTIDIFSYLSMKTCYGCSLEVPQKEKSWLTPLICMQHCLSNSCIPPDFPV